MLRTATPGGRVLARPWSGTIFDVVIAVAALAVTQSLLAHGGPGSLTSSADGHGPISMVLAAGSSLPLLVWRRSPIAVFVMTCAAATLLAGLSAPLAMMIGPAAALYLLAASRQDDSPWQIGTTITVVGLFMVYLVAALRAPTPIPGAEMLHTTLAWAVAWFAGERRRLLREHMAELVNRAVRAERETERERLLAMTQERARIARDLHDSAAHAINLIVVRAGAARLRHDEDPARCLQALEAIEEVARHTADDIDHILMALRQPDSTAGIVEAPIGLASLDTLVAHHRAAGLDVNCTTVGVPRPLGVVVDQGAYRILQEAVTNAARHGQGDAAIEVTFGRTALELSVVNSLTSSPSLPSAGGHGLIGMRERVRLLGGTLVRNCDEGSFEVSAHIPYGATSP